MKKPTVIAEIGCNHMGDINTAKEFIDVADNFCKVKAVKFQKRNVTELLTPEEYASPHPVAYHSYGENYGRHREYLEFSIEQHRELKNYCEERNVMYGCSVWDMTSLKEIISIAPDFIKIPSATNTHYELLKYICRNYTGKIHISIGMTTIQEERTIINLIKKHNRLKDTIIYACTSGYPVPPEDVCLMEVKRLEREYGNMVDSIGFSGHHNGISIDIAAYTLGAVYIERHFTLDRTWKGTDHAASLEPDGLRRLKRDLLTVEKSLRPKPKEILDIEMVQREKLKWDRHTSTPPVIPDVSEARAGADLKEIKMLVMDVDGVLTDGSMYYSPDGEALKRFSTYDGMGIELLREKGIESAIITKEKSSFAQKRADKLKIKHVFTGINDKRKCLSKLAGQLNLQLNEIAYIGDDVNDIEVIKIVGFSACPQNALESVKKAANYVCYKQGGSGAVREVCELILDSRNIVAK